MARLTFSTPEGDCCYGCMAFNDRSYYCKFFKESLHNENGCAGDLKCDKCKALGKFGCAKQER